MLRRFSDGKYFNFSSERGTWWAEHRVSEINGKSWGMFKRKWTRAQRAIVLLAHIRTPEALTVLKAMASGHLEARPTIVAKEALALIHAGPK